MTDQEKEVAPPSVAQMYRQGLRYATQAVAILDNGSHPLLVAEAAACAATAQAFFAGVQAAAHAMLALDVVSRIEDDSTLTTTTQIAILRGWRGVVEMSGGQ